MSELVLLVLRFGFLALLWVFVFAIVYALRTDLFGQRVRKLPATDAAPAPAASVPPAASPVASPAARPAPSEPASSAPGAIATRLVITAGAREGMEIPLEGEELTIGRASESGLVIRDDYTSTYHARLLKWAEGWVVQDLDSTNGTYLDGKKVAVPTLVPLGTTVRIGTTSFELRR
ncbi:FHA domain-containing protein [Galbitalea sp. SE-J8]|uniref:FHA domain-containing protein FhaB/FipA n=1 Tax=Galbitalea sp. SE-J8 TaxID=3054952 RepID=UPI00259D089F|nr:FHA domain-containing protein [Galbitalea sp. SE-J8]MDM4763283.1 FHA domain-containing protein [Galbitalea sp. SE-J8]